MASDAHLDRLDLTLRISEVENMTDNELAKHIRQVIMGREFLRKMDEQRERYQDGLITAYELMYGMSEVIADLHMGPHGK